MSIYRATSTPPVAWGGQEPRADEDPWDVTTLLQFDAESPEMAAVAYCRKMDGESEIPATAATLVYVAEVGSDELLLINVEQAVVYSPELMDYKKIERT